MMGMHGESWVNNAIQSADLLLALRHALRRPRHRQSRSTTRPTRKEDPHRNRSRPRSTRTSKSTSPSSATSRKQTLTPLLSTSCHPERSAGAPGLDAETWVRDTTKPAPGPDSGTWGRDNTKPGAPGLDSETWVRDTTAPWLAEINRSKGTAAVRDIINLPDNGHLYAAHVINDIWREAVAAGREKETIIVTDVGQHQMWEAQYFKHEAPRSLVTSGGLGTMGFALPAAIGAKFCLPRERTSGSSPAMAASR